mgnify:FL=1
MRLAMFQSATHARLAAMSVLLRLAANASTQLIPIWCISIMALALEVAHWRPTLLAKTVLAASKTATVAMQVDARHVAAAFICTLGRV